MAIQYNKLWKILIDRKMSKSELGKLADISPNTMTKLRRDEFVAMPILDRICETLNVDYGDIIEHLPNNKLAEKRENNDEHHPRTV